MSNIIEPKLKIASCTIKPNGAFASNSSITWSIVKDATFNSNFFTSITSSGSDIVINYPVVSKIHGFLVCGNKQLAQMGCFIGVDPGLSSATIRIFQKLGTVGGYIRGTNGLTPFWNLSSDCPNMGFQLGLAGFFIDGVTPYGTGVDGTGGIGGTTVQKGPYWKQISATYVGSTATIGVKKLLSGLGSATFGYNVINTATGSNISTNSTADVIEFTSNTPSQIQLNANLNDSQGWPGANILTSTASIGIFAILEL